MMNNYYQKLFPLIMLLFLGAHAYADDCKVIADKALDLLIDNSAYCDVTDILLKNLNQCIDDKHFLYLINAINNSVLYENKAFHENFCAKDIDDNTHRIIVCLLNNDNVAKAIDISESKFGNITSKIALYMINSGRYKFIIDNRDKIGDLFVAYAMYKLGDIDNSKILAQKFKNKYNIYNENNANYSRVPAYQQIIYLKMMMAEIGVLKLQENDIKVIHEMRKCGRTELFNKLYEAMNK